MTAVGQTDKVLVVDDDPLIRDLVETVLVDGGFVVLTAPNSEQAMALLERDRARDLAGLVTDIGIDMPDAGWAIAVRARQLNPALPVVYMTGDSADDWASRGVPNSVVLEKPFAPARVVVALSSLMNKAAGD